MRSLLIPTLLFAATAAAQTSAPAKPAESAKHTVAAPAEKPAADDKTFHSDALKLTFHYPTAYMDATSMMKPAMEAQMQKVPAEMHEKMKCMTVPLGLLDPTGGGVLILLRADSACMHEDFNEDTLAELAKGASGGDAAAAAGMKISDPAPYEIAGHKATVMRGSLNIPTGGTMTLTMACVLTNPDILCWQMMAPNPDAIATMSKLHVKFDGGGESEILPSTAAPAPTPKKP